MLTCLVPRQATGSQTALSRLTQNGAAQAGLKTVVVSIAGHDYCHRLAFQSCSLRQDASVIGLVGLAHASSHFSHLLLPLLFPVFMHEFGLDFTQLGFLMTVFFAVSGLGQAGAGFLVDRIGARPMMFVALGLFVLACLLARR